MRKITLLGLLSVLLLASCDSTPVDDSPQKLGSNSAKHVIQEFSDLQCPACAATSPRLEQFVKDNPELARLEYYHFPLSFHEHAFVAAEASECAADQGMFWEYIDQIFATQANLSEDHLYKVADSLNLDRAEFDECLDSNKHKRKIQSHMAKGATKRIPGTPTIFVNGDMVRFTDEESFKAYLESL